jgi:hypothetical protein
VSNTFIMRWPSLGKQVRCNKIDGNQHIFDWFEDQLPLKAVQVHTMVSGWNLYNVAVPLKKRMTWKPGSEVMEDPTKGPDGRISLNSPTGLVAEMGIRHGVGTENIDVVNIAQVRPEDLPILREVGAAQWKAVIQTKEVIVVEFVKAKEA